MVMMAAMMMLMTTPMIRIDWFPVQDGIIAGCQDEIEEWITTIPKRSFT